MLAAWLSPLQLSAFACNDNSIRRRWALACPSFWCHMHQIAFVKHPRPGVELRWWCDASPGRELQPQDRQRATPHSCILGPEGCGLLDFLIRPRKIGEDDGSEEGKDDDEGIEEIIRGGHSLSPYGFIITCRSRSCIGACLHVLLVKALRGRRPGQTQVCNRAQIGL